MNSNMMTVAEAKQVLGAEVPEWLIGSHWENGKFVCSIVIRTQLEEHIAEEAAKVAARAASKAARDASNAKFLSRSRLVVAKEGGE